jgi:RNA polymerase sigma-70 factor, ECF subfamily
MYPHALPPSCEGGDRALTYATGSVERRLLDNDPRAVGQVGRWIALALTSPRFWVLRGEWPDIHQDVLARVIESLRQERYDPSRDLRTYVQGITRHTALQALDRQGHQPDMVIQDSWPDQVATNPERRAAIRQMARQVLDMATEECRDLIRSYYYDERSYAEIAERLESPVGTIKSRLFRCLEAAYRALHGVPRRVSRRDRSPDTTREEEDAS